MSQLQVYNPKKNELTPIAFVKDTPNQTKVRDISRYELLKQIGILCAAQMVYLGIKGTMSDFDKKDILELIQMRFKSLSLNEIEYAFRLERYGEYKYVNPKTRQVETNRTEHYQLFNSEYVSEVLDKYVIWKRERMSEHQIKALPAAKKVTDKEKRYWISRGLQTAFAIYKKERRIPENYTYVYEILYDDGFLPTDAAHKEKKMEDAKIAIRLEYEEKEAMSREEKNVIRRHLEATDKTRHPIVISWAKRLMVQDYFRGIMKNQEELNRFNTRYPYGESGPKGSLETETKKAD